MTPLLSASLALPLEPHPKGSLSLLVSHAVTETPLLLAILASSILRGLSILDCKRLSELLFATTTTDADNGDFGAGVFSSREGTGSELSKVPVSLIDFAMGVHNNKLSSSAKAGAAAGSPIEIVLFALLVSICIASPPLVFFFAA